MSQTATQKQCTESKTGQVHSVHTQPSLRAQACPGRTRGGHVVGTPWPCRSPATDRVAGLAVVSWSCAVRRHSRVMACLAIQCLISSSPLVTIHYRVLRYKISSSHTSRLLRHDTISIVSLPSPPTTPRPSHDTPQCISTQPPQPFKPPQSRYKICIMTQPSPRPNLRSCHDTLGVLRHKIQSFQPPNHDTKFVS